MPQERLNHTLFISKQNSDKQLHSILNKYRVMRYRVLSSGNLTVSQNPVSTCGIGFAVIDSDTGYRAIPGTGYRVLAVPV